MMDESKRAKLIDICEMKHTLIGWAKSEIDKGVECCDAKDLGEVTDMIKDLAEAEAKCWEGAYYEAVTMAMYGADSGMEDSMGYNPNRSATTGRYMSSRMGFKMNEQPYIREYLENSEDFRDRMMDYHDGMNADYGRAYNDYRQARRHYTETKSQADKDEMSEKATEHVMNTIATMRDIWKNADPDMRKRMKKDFQNLLEEMN